MMGDNIIFRALVGHASIATTRLYDRCESRPEDPPMDLMVY